MAFKMKGSPYKNVGYTKYGPKSAAFQKETRMEGPRSGDELTKLQQLLGKTEDPNKKNEIKKAIQALLAKKNKESTYGSIGYQGRD